MTAGSMQPYALTLDKFLDHAAKWHGGTEVVTNGPGGSTRIDYAGLRARADSMSGALSALGLNAGDNFATLCGTARLIWNADGAIRFGIICHTLNPRLSSVRIEPSGPEYVVGPADSNPIEIDVG